MERKKQTNKDRCIEMYIISSRRIVSIKLIQKALQAIELGKEGKT